MRLRLSAATISAALVLCAPAEAQVRPGSAPIPAPGQWGAPGPAAPDAGSRVWQNGRWHSLPPRSNVVRHQNSNRWSFHRDGRWDAGHRAPGGWNGYRRLGRGHRLPQYWMSSAFFVPDYLAFGLSAPPRGYHWVRYYDDAVLVDDRGDVWDSIDGIGWGGGFIGNEAEGYGSHSESYNYSGAGAGYGQPIQPVDPNGYYAEHSYQGAYAPPPPQVVYGPPVPHVQSYGYQGYQGGYYGGAYGTYGSASVTVIQLPPTVITTVVEEVIETTTTYARATPRRVVRRPAVKRKAPVRAVKPRVCCCVCR